VGVDFSSTLQYNPLRIGGPSGEPGLNLVVPFQPKPLYNGMQILMCIYPLLFVRMTVTLFPSFFIFAGTSEIALYSAVEHSEYDVKSLCNFH
jgi:hypothetical protein